MSKADMEKGLALPDLGDVYGGVEDSAPVGGMSEQSDAIAASSSSSPKATGTGGSWFTKKRIIIIAVVVVIVVAGAVGGGVGGALGSKKSSSPDTSGSGSTGGSQTSGGPTSAPATGTSGGSGSAATSPAAASTIVPTASTTGLIIPSGVTAVAFSGVAKPTVSSTPLDINLGFPGLSPNFELSAASIAKNGDFTNNLTNWEDKDGCWGVEKWDGKYYSAWNGAKPSPAACELFQLMDRGDNAGKDTDYVVSFLYRNAQPEATNNAWLWAYIGDEDTVSQVLATNEKKTTASDNWDKAAFKYTVKANKKARIVFKGYNDGYYWEVSMVQIAPLEVLNT
ncbi:hypothetical protein H072_6572 [Dactylellina haptotyla CBS 200.50]|uniref:Uncharacterized protein n=1 Tax=Dactylellina haptotyla (strain CBS 200.50) TaxID=1284197 RepID=S8A9Q3_DACHA|nr:hypothetical protein H072_6572 [Dactylellina haptotyla CBS 200.50]